VTEQGLDGVGGEVGRGLPGEDEVPDQGDQLVTGPVLQPG
jgi:hypothetical protein